MKLILLTIVLITQLLFFSQSSKVRADIPQVMVEKILSKDYAIARKALTENQVKRDTVAVCLSLKNQMLEIKLLAASALRSIKDKSSVECLIRALKENQIPHPGGTEDRILQDEIDENIVLALQELIEIKVPPQNKKQIKNPIIKKSAFTRDQVSEVIRMSEVWLAKKNYPNKSKKR